MKHFFLKLKNKINISYVVTIFLVFSLSLKNPKIINFQSDSELIVKKSIELSINDKIIHHGGFMIVPKELGYSDKDSPYYSQFGLQYKLLTIPAFLFRKNFDLYFLLVKYSLILLFSITLSLFIEKIKKEFGKYSSVFLFIGIITSPWLIKFSSNMYWITFLAFLPFIFSWVFYRKKFFDFGIFILIFIKSLCGYEYLSNILLSSLIPIIYFEMKNNKKNNFKKLISKLIKTFLIGCTGFIAAFLANLIQASLYLSSLQKGFNSISQSAVYRTIGDALGKKISISTDLKTYFDYFNQKYFLVFSEHQIIIIIIFLFILINFLCKKLNQKADNKLFFLALIGLIFSLSWNSIALGHMRYHLHINPITFYIPFNLLAYAYIGQSLGIIKKYFKK